MNVMLQAALALALVGFLVFVVAYPLGTWLFIVFNDKRHWRAERMIYRVVGVDPDNESRWSRYALSVLCFAVVGVVAVWLLIMAQPWLPWSFGRVQTWHGALNTAISFVTNTNWQSYAGEAGAGYSVQMVALTVQNFVSAATGLAVAIAVMRGIARTEQHNIGNFWVDLTRSCTRVLLPLAVIATTLLIIGGTIQNLNPPTDINAMSGGSQVIQGGPVASQEAIKMLGTNGGGFYNANSAHPFENPSAWTNLLQIILVLIVPFALTRTYGLMVGDKRQGRLLAVVMGGLFAVSALLIVLAEATGSGSSGGMEGKEQRFGIVWSSIFGAATTGTSTGGVNSMHESYSPLGGGLLMLNMMLGEVSPGGVGTGMYGMVVLAVLTVFIAGLMVGRTPELLGKTIGRREITFAATASMVMPVLVLLGTAASLVLPAAKQALSTSGPHALSEMLYAFTSAGNNNGSAFAGLSADQPWLNLTLGLVMFVARFAVIVLVLALAGALASQRRRPVTSGTLPTHTPIFGVLLVGIILLIAGLTFFPALALGPLAEALS